jgi:hypothetical protein
MNENKILPTISTVNDRYKINNTRTSDRWKTYEECSMATIQKQFINANPNKLSLLGQDSMW